MVKLFYVALFSLSVSAIAQTIEVENGFRRLHEGSDVVRRISLEKIPFPDGEVRSLDLAPVVVWTPGARVTINDGRTTRNADVAPPRCFRGRVRGVAESMAAVCVGRTGALIGNITDRTTLFRLASIRDHVYLTRDEPDDHGVRPPGQGWTCQTEDDAPARFNAAALAPRSRSLPTYTAQYVLTVAIETDFELYQAAGSDPQSLADYVTSLMNAVAAIYERDLQTTVLISGLHFYTSKSGSYPWTAEPTVVGGKIDNHPALYQLADYYHGTNGETAPPYAGDRRSVALYLSGRDWGGGRAWRASACSRDELQPDGHWTGSYAFCGNIEFGSVPNPDDSNDGTAFAVPRSNYFSLYGTAHELGHTIGSPHTHCIGLTAADQSLYNVTRSFVDTCWAGDTGCYNGGTTDAPPELGTIMSYCHLLRSFFDYPKTRYTFGQFGEPSEKVINNYITPYLTNATPPMSSITAPQSVPAGSSGHTASTYDLGPGFTYAWSVGGGTITAGQGTSAITFSVASDPVIVNLTVTNDQGCGVSDFVHVAVNGPPPTLWSQQPDHSVSQQFANGRPALDFLLPTSDRLPKARYAPFYIGLPAAGQSACVMRYLTLEWYPNAQRNPAERLGFALMDGIGGTWETAPDGGHGLLLTVLRNQQDDSDPEIGPNDYFRFAAGDCGDASRSITFGFDGQNHLSYFVGSSKSEIIILLGGTPSLFGTLTATPAIGSPPLTTSLAATVTGGTAEGTVNYTFWWNCADAGASVAAVTAVCGDPTNPLYGAKFDGIVPTSKTVVHDYTTGTYTAKVILERGTAAPTTATTSVSVARAPGAGNLMIAAQPSTSPGDYRYFSEPIYQAFTPATSGVPTKLTLQYSGFFNNPFNPAINITIYDTADYAQVSTAPVVALGGTGVLCSGCNAFQEIDIALSSSTKLLAGHVYTIKVERSGFGDFALNGTMANLLGFASSRPPTNLYFLLEGVDSTLTAALDASPPIGATPLSVTLTATAGGTASGTVNYTFWWNCADAGASVAAVTAVCGDPANPLYGAKFDGIVPTSKTVVHNYTTGNYTAKVILERGTAAPTTATTSVSVARAPGAGNLMIAAQPSTSPGDYRYTSQSFYQAFTATAGGVPRKLSIQYSGFFNNPFNPAIHATIYDSVDYAQADAAAVVAEGSTGGLCSGCNAFQEIDIALSSSTRMTAGHGYTIKLERSGQGDYALNGTTANLLGFASSRPPTNLYFLLEGVDSILTAALEASPGSGPAPLDVTLTASAGGTATGAVNYIFWWNCADGGTSVAAVAAACGDPTNAANGARFGGVSSNTQQAAHTYDFAGTYTAKVIAERGTAAPAEQRSTITVAPRATLTAQTWANPSTGTASLTTSLSAAVTGGDAVGPIDYTFWWNCTDNGITVQSLTAACGDPTNGAVGARFTGVAAFTQHAVHTYGAGTFTAKVIVERGGAPPVVQSVIVTASSAAPDATVVLHQTSSGLGCSGSISGPITGQELDWGTISPGTSGWLTQLRYGSGWTAVGNVGLKIVDDTNGQTVFFTAVGPDTTDDTEFGIAFNVPASFYVTAGRPYHIYGEFGSVAGRDSHAGCDHGDRREIKMRWLGTLEPICAPTTVTNPVNASGTVGQPFMAIFQQTGITGTATFSLASGVLPAGLVLSAAGVLSGTPAETGNFAITVKATAANGCAGTGAAYQLRICPAIIIGNPATATAVVGAPLNVSFSQNGAVSPTFSTNSALPAGITLSPAGVLSGTPAAVGSFPITVTVTDSNDCTGVGTTYTLAISCSTIDIGPASLPDAAAGTAFSTAFTATGAIGAVTWSLQGALPAGITLVAGSLSGTPTQCGTFPITVSAADDNHCSASRSYSLTVTCPALTITFLGDGSGMVTSDPAGISCPSTCSASFSLNATVTLSIQSAAGSTFEGWGGECSGMSCQASMTQNRSVTAKFTTHGLYVLTPCRLLDTRNPVGPFGGPPLPLASTRNLQVTGRCGIAADAAAVAVNVVAVTPTAGGYVTVYPGPAGSQRPVVSTINYSTARTLANNAVVKLGPDGTMNLYNAGPNLDFVIDVTGYFK